jgi:hypothetical protein
MTWIFIVSRNSCIERVKTFNDYWEGSKFTDKFIYGIDPNIVTYPSYNRDENYRKDDLTIGLYKSE